MIEREEGAGRKENSPNDGALKVSAPEHCIEDHWLLSSTKVLKIGELILAIDCS